MCVFLLCLKYWYLVLRRARSRLSYVDNCFHVDTRCVFHVYAWYYVLRNGVCHPYNPHMHTHIHTPPHTINITIFPYTYICNSTKTYLLCYYTTSKPFIMHMVDQHRNHFVIIPVLMNLFCFRWWIYQTHGNNHVNIYADNRIMYRLMIWNCGLSTHIHWQPKTNA